MRVVWIAPYPVSIYLGLNGDNEHLSPWVVALARKLDETKQIDLDIVALNRAVRTPQVFECGKRVKLHILPKLSIKYALPSFFLTEIFKLKKYVKSLLPDIIHIHGTEEFTILFPKGVAPVVVSMQGIISACRKSVGRGSPFLWRVAELREKIGIAKNKYFLTRTEFDHGYVKSIKPDAVIYHLWEVIDQTFSSVVRESYQEKSILFVGGRNPVKGFDILIEALPSIVEKFPGLTCHVVGMSATDLLKRDVERLKSLKVEENFIFHGRLNPSALATLHGIARVFVLPSRCENSPNALCEAMLSGLPVVAARVGGIPSIIEHEKTGYLFDPLSPKSLSHSVCYALQNPDLTKTIARNAQNIAKMRHQPDEIAQKLLDFYNDIIRRESR